MPDELLSSRTAFLSAFEAIEVDLELGQRAVQGIHWWDLTRYPFYWACLRDVGLASPAASQPPLLNPRRFLRAGANLGLALTTRAPKGSAPVVILGHPRRIHTNGRWIDPYVDPLLPLLPDDREAIVLEEPMSSAHRSPAPTPPSYLDALLLRARIREQRIRGLSAQERAAVTDVGARFRAELGTRVDLLELADKAVRRFQAQQPLYRRLLERLNPEYLLLVRSAGQEDWVAAARSLGIPSAELQHGSPARGKLNYDYSSGVGKRLFPDVFASFGSFWTEGVTLPVGGERIVELGFANLSAPDQPEVIRRDQLLIISQPDVADSLERFSCDLVATIPESVSVVYKPHPAEFGSDTERFERLTRAGVQVVTNPRADLYELLLSSRWQVGVYSTAIYEGVTLGCTTFILKAPGSESMDRLVGHGYAQFVVQPSDIDLGAPTRKPAEPLFAEASQESVQRLFSALDEVREEARATR